MVDVDAPHSPVGRPRLLAPLTPLHAAAREYASQYRLLVIPLHPGEKRPAFISGPNHDTLATLHVERIDDWWGMKDYNLGLPCTANRLAVIDVDGPEGDAHLTRLEAEYGPLPATWTQSSNREDRTSVQLVYEWPNGELVPTGRISEQLEVRAHGAQIVVAPSIHPSGSTYSWVTPPTPEQPRPAPLPQWVVDLLTLPAPPETPADLPTVEPEGHRPGDDYNNRPDTIIRSLNLLQQHGWKLAYTRGDVHYLVRPGKDIREGISASLGHPNTGHGFYVFTTSSDFETGRRYSPFAVYTHLEHGGDWKAAAHQLQQDGYGDQTEPNPLQGLREVPDPDHLEDLDMFLNSPEPEYDWIVEGLLERGDRVILTGTEGAGKTTLLRQIAVTAAAGIHPFTSGEITPQRVLYVDLENSVRHSRRQFRPLRIQAGKDLADQQMFPIIRPDGLNLLDTKDQEWLQQTIDQVTPDMVIIGPVYKLVGGDPTEELPAKAASTLLDVLRTSYGFALLMEAHSPHESQGRKRPKRPYGASLWLRWPEFGLHINDQGALSHWRGARDERAWPALLKRGGEWPWTLSIDLKDIVWQKILAHCENQFLRPSIRVLASAIEENKGRVERAIDAHRDEWENLFQEVTE